MTPTDWDGVYAAQERRRQEERAAQVSRSEGERAEAAAETPDESDDDEFVIDEDATREAAEARNPATVPTWNCVGQIWGSDGELEATFDADAGFDDERQRENLEEAYGVAAQLRREQAELLVHLGVKQEISDSATIRPRTQGMTAKEIEYAQNNSELAFDLDEVLAIQQAERTHQVTVPARQVRWGMEVTVEIDREEGAVEDSEEADSDGSDESYDDLEYADVFGPGPVPAQDPVDLNDARDPSEELDSGLQSLEEEDEEEEEVEEQDEDEVDWDDLEYEDVWGPGPEVDQPAADPFDSDNSQNPSEELDSGVPESVEEEDDEDEVEDEEVKDEDDDDDDDLMTEAEVEARRARRRLASAQAVFAARDYAARMQAEAAAEAAHRQTEAEQAAEEWARQEAAEAEEAARAQAAAQARRARRSQTSAQAVIFARNFAAQMRAEAAAEAARRQEEAEQAAIVEAERAALEEVVRRQAEVEAEAAAAAEAEAEASAREEAARRQAEAEAEAAAAAEAEAEEAARQEVARQQAALEAAERAEAEGAARRAAVAAARAREEAEMAQQGPRRSGRVRNPVQRFTKRDPPAPRLARTSTKRKAVDHADTEPAKRSRTRQIRQLPGTRAARQRFVSPPAPVNPLATAARPDRLAQEAEVGATGNGLRRSTRATRQPSRYANTRV